MSTRTKTTFFAVCNVNGPISVKLDATTLADALTEFEAAPVRAWIDSARTDAEDALDVDGGAEMYESEFAEALEAAGCTMVRDLSVVHNSHAGTTAHLAGGWTLWQRNARSAAIAERLARQLYRDDCSRADEVPVQRDGGKAYAGWRAASSDAGDTETKDALESVDADDFAAAWEALVQADE